MARSLHESSRLTEGNEEEHGATIAAARWQAAVQHIEPADLLAEIYALHARLFYPEHDPLKPLVDLLLANPPHELYGTREHDFHVAPHLLEYTGRRWIGLVARAFDAVVRRELDRMAPD